MSPRITYPKNCKKKRKRLNHYRFLDLDKNDPQLGRTNKTQFVAAKDPTELK